MSDAREVAIALSDVSKSFRADRGLLRRMRGMPGTSPRAVLDGVSLDVRRGEIFGLVGANGAGKTTLLKILATVLLPDRGRVLVDGIDALADPALVRRRLAVVPADERALFWRISATENVRLFASLYGLRGTERDAAVARALDLVGLGDTGRQQVGSFSSGMRQRTLIARALVTRPPILILDEPTRSLDPLTARELRRFIRDVLCTELGATILLATHSTEEALQLCDRAALLVRGRVIATDTLAELRVKAGGARVRVRVDAAHEARARTLLHLPVDVISTVVDGMVTLDATLPDASHAPVVIEALVRAGVRVAEFAPVPVSLADLLDSVHSPASHDGALRHA
ncbi:MAG TPA: ABC transporter ATP-binding protein [Gemmatimonadaceae bacterium]|nr:ABC transporter ATP-binding protein [Gemmatimonadaceae bacterium]